MRNPNVRDVYFSMKHPAYQNVPVGTSTFSIGEVGCLLCSLSSMLASYGIPVTPPKLNWYLLHHSGYIAENLIVFNSLKPFGFELVKRVNCRSTPASTVEIEDNFEQGKEIFVEVNFSRYTNRFYPHWCWVRGIGEEDYDVFDPIVPPNYNPIVPLLATYGKKGWNLSRVITGYAIYEFVGVGKNGQQIADRD